MRTKILAVFVRKILSGVSIAAKLLVCYYAIIALARWGAAKVTLSDATVWIIFGIVVTVSIVLWLIEQYRESVKEATHKQQYEQAVGDWNEGMDRLSQRYGRE